MSRTRNLVEEELVRIATAYFTERGYQNTTLADIVSQVGISRVTFYTYFESKAALLAEVFARSLSAYRRGLIDIVARPLSRPEKIRQAMVLQITSLSGEHSLMRFLFREEVNLPAEAVKVVVKMRQEIDRLMEKEVENGIQRGELIDEDPRLLVQAFMGMCNWLYRWYQPGDAIAPDEIIRVFTRILESGSLTIQSRADDTSVTSSLRQVKTKLGEVEQELAKVSSQLRSNEHRPRGSQRDHPKNIQKYWSPLGDTSAWVQVCRMDQYPSCLALGRPGALQRFCPVRSTSPA